MNQDTLVPFEGIPFNAEDVCSTSKKEFTERTKKQYWQDIPSKQRIEKLNAVYDECKEALAKSVNTEKEPAS